MTIPGVRAKKTGTKLARGAAVQVMCYPRPRTKAVLVEASRRANTSLSSFVVMAALKQVAALEQCQIEDLIPSDELQPYSASRVDRKRRSAAKRAWVTRRARESATRDSVLLREVLPAKPFVGLLPSETERP
jgi:hypothetical protein